MSIFKSLLSMGMNNSNSNSQSIVYNENRLNSFQSKNEIMVSISNPINPSQKK
ncbi:hypothetical protein DDB_G0290167 [Dictyostelium discoideum AX4]|uniref:Putative uncharacterized protein DDB_G0290167 n=1 Tax=Dictyostelium discoideum TaxID=44689 RepID=Y8754_DICDI|nr:hypothetical protein DDB_G0290167 [Dictyostelium discoideum AX4]Q54GH1.1 RecName: Full=Putative uncharacterized protein DDB_G0290167 [Dictyostelium discoideum]EAL62355.1 hypothetical protein DDB_G0290167 [Dictyostelium discoideum AX4]|eukprot:XP_635857.1 hypothetical protein DDB_G0290167 [Dictyostelium discoideum AX4]